MCINLIFDIILAPQPASPIQPAAPLQNQATHQGSYGAPSHASGGYA